MAIKKWGRFSKITFIVKNSGGVLVKITFILKNRWDVLVKKRASSENSVNRGVSINTAHDLLYAQRTRKYLMSTKDLHHKL